jgi:CheY-like chemotaxis protein
MATILCIDDEPDLSQVRKYLLESRGYEVIDARSGEEGIRLFQSQKVDVVIVDYWMAGMNGLAVARRVKKLSFSPDWPNCQAKPSGSPIDGL